MNSLGQQQARKSTNYFIEYNFIVLTFDENYPISFLSALDIGVSFCQRVAATDIASFRLRSTSHRAMFASIRFHGAPFVQVMDLRPKQIDIYFILGISCS